MILQTPREYIQYDAPKVDIDRPLTGQDDMRKEKSREEYYREAAQFMNKAEAVVNQNGMYRTVLNFLTRGQLLHPSALGH
jgi:hypothetical protein